MSKPKPPNPETNPIVPQAAAAPISKPRLRLPPDSIKPAARRPWTPRESTHSPVASCQILTTYFNPCRYRRPFENYLRFREEIGGEVLTAELAFDDDPFQLPEEPGMYRFRGTRERHWVWQKERLLNLLIERATAPAVAWVDADMLFSNQDWLAEGLERLANFKAVQPWATIAETDASGHIFRRRNSHTFTRVWGLAGGRPGGAWMARRRDLRMGLYDRCLVGGGDSLTVSAWGTQRWPGSMRGDAWRRHWWDWCSRQRVRDSYSFVRGEITHMYHGHETNRRYNHRNYVLSDYAYDPGGDVEIDPVSGLLQWSEQTLREKPDMVAGVRQHFEARREDD